MRSDLKRAGIAVVLIAVIMAASLVLASCSADEAGPSSSGAAQVAAVSSSANGANDTTPELPTTTTEPRVTKITIAAVGDVMGHIAVLRAAKAEGAKAENGPEYDFWPIFAPIAPYLSAADYTVCNLETRLAGSEHRYTTYPRFNSPETLADALVACGVDLAATANNHTLDRGWAGIVNTLDNLDAAGLAHVGTHRSLEEKSTPFIVDIEGIKVAFLNYTDYLNEFTPPKPHREYAVNVLDYRDWTELVEEAEAARAAGADVVITVLHWGREFCTRPWDYQVDLAEGSEDEEGLLARGVDVILGAHPHVVEPIVRVPQYSGRETRDTYVVYSMGNFMSGMKGKRTSIGVIVYVNIEKQGRETRVTGIDYLPVMMQQSGPYPRKLRVLPVMPGLEPETDTTVTESDQERMDWTWEYLYGHLCRPGDNIHPLDLPE